MPSNSSKTRSAKPAPAAADQKPELGPPEMEEFRHRVGYVLRSAHIASLQHFGRTVTKAEISPLQYTLLLIIDRRPGLNPAEISKAIGVKRTNVAVLLRDLEDKGMIRRRPAQHDKRFHGIELTPTGSRKMAGWMKLADLHEQRLASLIGVSQREDFLRVLQRIADGLSPDMD